MPELPLGRRTDLAVLKLSGAQITDFNDYILVESADNPGYHWGNFIVVTSMTLASDPARCIRVFEKHLPLADHIAIGLPAPASPVVWKHFDLELEIEEVMTLDSAPLPRALPIGFEVRQLVAEEDWEQQIANEFAQRPIAEDPVAYGRFVRGVIDARRRLVRDGNAAFFGVLVDGRLAAELGIVLCPGEVARYQSVATVPADRRQGLAGHLLGVAGRWAAQQGARRWVIVADRDSDASRLYKSVGFRGGMEHSFQAYRPGRATRDV